MGCADGETKGTIPKKLMGHAFGVCYGNAPRWHAKYNCAAQECITNLPTCSAQQNMTTQLWTEPYSTEIIAAKLAAYMQDGNKSIAMSAASETNCDSAVHDNTHRFWRGPRAQHRCGVKGGMTITYWYKPPSPTMPCNADD